ncbi:trimeric intracellular cation channel family protein [Aurantiacibacter sp. D1-12]|uniref:trimeric intracellular cation channel family protein n=1 Tax=Aurantiacibacter sp. D1-12 TaxID=2993658 RepID=UPI00237CA0BC|nr:trimeric intracellular cation channel family protein [Aurantiacibacter sp. D1-12]MDE1468010.1 trimeric intracellular cation channel family protein [Aurantiacibacter sp. D1-12]
MTTTVEVITPVLPPILDLGGTAVFALSGALLAARLNQTFVTCAFFALLTGVGGGSVRDALLGVPAFWIRDFWVLPVVLGASLVAWFIPRKWWEGRWLEWADALGLALFCALGTAKALAFDVAPLAAVVLGVITGCVGGIIRDVIAGVPSIIMRPELYVTAAALTAGSCAIMILLGVQQPVAMTVAAAAGFTLRGAAMIWSIELPAYSREA